MKAVEELLGKKVIVRSFGAGVFYGTLAEAENSNGNWTAELRDCRRIWSWQGACSLSQLSLEGTKKPQECKFSVMEYSVVVSGIVEFHGCSEEAVKSIESVGIWKV